MPALRNLTLGRYVPTASVVHGLDPRTKLLASIGLMVSVLATPNLPVLGLYFGFLAVSTRASRLPAAMLLRNLQAFTWLFLFTIIMHALMTPGTVLLAFPWWNLTVTREGAHGGLFYGLRLAAVIVTASLLTLTTAPLELTGGLERLLGPLRRIGVPAHDLALMITIALRFIPVLIDEAERLRKAQLARGADFGGGPLRRARQMIPLLAPLFISAFDRADRLALAMESRCYRGGEGRTSYHELRFRRHDLLAALIATMIGLGITIVPRLLHR